MRRYIVICALFLVVGAALFYLLIPHSSSNSRQVTLSFGGYTNASAVIAIHNTGSTPVVLRDFFEMEYVGITSTTPVGGFTNVIRLTPTGTNLGVGPSKWAIFLIPVPTEGQRWVAHLEFALGGIKTTLGEYLIRRQDRVSTLLPTSLRGVPIYTVSQEFSR